MLWDFFELCTRHFAKLDNEAIPGGAKSVEATQTQRMGANSAVSEMQLGLENVQAAFVGHPVGRADLCASQYEDLLHCLLSDGKLQC